MSEEGHSESVDGAEATEGSVPPQDYAPPPAASEPPPPAAQVSAPPQDSTPKKKRKIDLKSRLSSVRASGSMALSSSPSGAERKSDPLAFPPPPATGSVPAPRLPGVGPLVKSAFAPPEPEKKASAVAQTIKVEVGEEIQQERAKTKKKSAIYITIAAVMAMVMGFFLGQARERGRAGNLAVEGAQGLATDVENANKTMSTLSDALRNAVDQLAIDEFPNDLEELLKTNHVDFDATKFKGRYVGGLPPEVFNPLLAYTNEIEKLNKQKDSLRNLLGAAKPQVEKYIAEKSKPTIKFAILFGKQGDNQIAELVPLKEPFQVKGDWPGKFTILQPADKGKTKESEVNRYTDKGKLDGEHALPIQPKSVAGFTDLTLIYKLRNALTDLRLMIEGNESPENPSLATDGLLKDGKELVEGLERVARAGG